MNSNKLRAKITERGMTVKSFCQEFGFVRSTFDRKLKGDYEFTRDEIEKIWEALELTEEEVRDIFFENKVA